MVPDEKGRLITIKILCPFKGDYRLPCILPIGVLETPQDSLRRGGRLRRYQEKKKSTKTPQKKDIGKRPLEKKKTPQSFCNSDPQNLIKTLDKFFNFKLKKKIWKHPKNERKNLRTKNNKKKRRQKIKKQKKRKKRANIN